MKSYDIIVVGGGLSGTCAAISASRNGLKTLLVEKSNCLGGAATLCLANPFMPNSTRINGKKVELSQGIFKEIVERLEKRQALLWQSHFLEEELKYILNEMVLENGADLLFHASLVRANVSNNKIDSIVLATVDGERTYGANYYIDATGDALLSHLAGCKTRLGRENDNLCQPMTLCFRVGNVDTDSFYKGLDKLQEKYKEATKDKKLTNPRENILVFSTPIKNVLHFNTTRVIKKSPVSPEEKTKAEIIARRQVFEMYDFIKKHGQGMENSFLMMTGHEIGVRESRKILGEYVLTEGDCLSCTKFDDSIAACNYDIDMHNPEGSGTSHHYFKDGEYYTIPYRALLPKEISNLLVAGRCISSDQGAQASFRIMPTVCCIGEAGGTAIAVASKSSLSVKDIDVSLLQDTLKKNGAFIGI